MKALVHPRSAQITIDLPGADEELREQVLEEYFSSFSGYIRRTLLGLQTSGTGRYEFHLGEYFVKALFPACQ